jgi:hypothetical protein
MSYIILLLDFYRKIWRRKYHFIIFGMFAILSITIPGSALASSGSPYDSGYNHGCDDARISDYSDRYINQDEKGPSFHTPEFMNGYNAGVSACSSSEASPPLSSSQQSSNPDTVGNQLLCYGAGGVLMMLGVDGQTVSGLGHQAHDIGVCP